MAADNLYGLQPRPTPSSNPLSANAHCAFREVNLGELLAGRKIIHRAPRLSVHPNTPSSANQVL